MVGQHGKRPESGVSLVFSRSPVGGGVAVVELPQERIAGIASVITLTVIIINDCWEYIIELSGHLTLTRIIYTLCTTK